MCFKILIFSSGFLNMYFTYYILSHFVQTRYMYGGVKSPNSVWIVKFLLCTILKWWQTKIFQFVLADRLISTKVYILLTWNLEHRSILDPGALLRKYSYLILKVRPSRQQNINVNLMNFCYYKEITLLLLLLVLCYYRYYFFLLLRLLLILSLLPCYKYYWHSN